MKDPGGGDVRNIRHFVVTNAVNPETQRIMKRALGMDYSQWQDLKWPGVVFSTDTDEGKALLGRLKIWLLFCFLLLTSPPLYFLFENGCGGRAC